MKPPPFDYLAAQSIDEAVDALATPGAMVLAGGQSLLLELAYRTVRPNLLVDINRVAGLAEVRDDATGLSIGALVRHAEFDRSATTPVRRLLAKAARYLAHPPIRVQGTFCGSLAWAHPSAEWNLIACALDAELALRSRAGERRVSISEFLRGAHRTAIRPGELITSVRLAPVAAGSGTGFAEHRRTHSGFADVAAAAVVTADGAAIGSARIAIAGIGVTPLRVASAEQAVTGAAPAAAADRAGAAVHRPGGTHHDAVASELVRRAVAEAVGEL